LHHDVGVGRVGAGGDGGNDHRTVGKRVVFVLKGELGGLFGGFGLESEPLETDLVGETLFPVGLHVGEGDSVVGTFGSGQTGFDCGEVEFHGGAGEFGVHLSAVVGTEESLSS